MQTIKITKKTIMHVKYELVQVVLEVIILILCNDAIIITEIKRIFHCLNRKHSDICVSRNTVVFLPQNIRWLIDLSV